MIQFFGPYDDVTDEMLQKQNKNKELLDKRELLFDKIKEVIPLEVFDNLNKRDYVPLCKTVELLILGKVKVTLSTNILRKHIERFFHQYFRHKMNNKEWFKFRPKKKKSFLEKLLFWRK